MAVELYPTSIQIDETTDKQLLAVTVENNVAGSADITFFIYEPVLRGEDYPALVRAWDNEGDDIFDNL